LGIDGKDGKDGIDGKDGKEELDHGFISKEFTLFNQE
jgi:hypothetical protein